MGALRFAPRGGAREYPHSISGNKRKKFLTSRRGTFMLAKLRKMS